MKSYDRSYFDRWYRSDAAPRGHDELLRSVTLAVAVTEYVLDRPIQSVLDVGCGEGRWFPVLHELRPDAVYLGIDSSEYCVEQFGEKRNIRRGTFEELERHVFEEPFDLVVCVDVLHYLDEAAIGRGLDTFVDLVGGAAMVEVFSETVPVVGDKDGFTARPAAWYRGMFEGAGLVPLGLQMYTHREIAEEMDGLEAPSLLDRPERE